MPPYTRSIQSCIFSRGVRLQTDRRLSFCSCPSVCREVSCSDQIDDFDSTTVVRHGECPPSPNHQPSYGKGDMYIHMRGRYPSGGQRYVSIGRHGCGHWSLPMCCSTGRSPSIGLFRGGVRVAGGSSEQNRICNFVVSERH